MFLTITSTSDRDEAPATDLGYLLHKHPDRAQKFGLPVGTAHVFYPRADATTCTAALLLEVDPIALVRGRGSRPVEGFSLAQYVNDRPYAASSLLAVALGKVFKTAISGRCDVRPELPGTPLRLEIEVPALPCRGDAHLARNLFEPLGWTCTVTPVPLDPELGWGDSPYVDLRLTGELLLSEALSQLYVLLPVLDDAKHYWVTADEVDKLVRAGEGWLAAHPERALITQRYLRHQRWLIDDAAERFAGLEDAPAPEGELLEEPLEDDDAPPEARVSLASLRLDALVETLEACGAQSVADLGCGEGKLLGRLLENPRYQRILGVDVSHRALRTASRRLRLDDLPDRAAERIELRQSSLVYADPSLAGFDAAVLSEVIEHVDESRLPALASSVFGTARPGVVLVTTPNVEHNQHFGLSEGQTRHTDHRFEWDRATFQAWAGAVAEQYGYTVRFKGVGVESTEAGPPTQMAVLTLDLSSAAEVSR
ncbi:3' terminal RNA ribose 2'-O-methyltransferase Hen1 [Kineosporia sp. NBRC 101731]|uniref:3' terminal RNA ribose 2'-O-methyltransferase Hen1 n=1 Tax=Kineosporia sp. NBRC 101731 TaxID=3032199 RepID=UPI0024A4E03C|nr:3' terminal RNA ribose 2'-O-methyltransferase Hen1 [Kineosporia sp. NBRC 101731]GLY27921.1 3' terminal RNA ribose 2'-O-methyltransferase Hen1 [Kineosporia sp. NBRC 101731]